MAYAVVIYPNVHNNTKIQSLRKKYDPQFRLIKPHITLIFPFPDTDRERITSHVSQTAGAHEEFDLRLKGTRKSFDNWLFLTTKEGTSEIKNLHNRLYTGILEKYLRKDIAFIPHVGLGKFKDSADYKKAEREAKTLNLDFRCKVKSIDLIHLKDDLFKIDWSAKYALKPAAGQ